jgi:hypothetical protein
MSEVLTVKRGDTFKLSCTYLVDGVAAALPPGIKSQIRYNGVLVAELTATVVDAPTGRYDLSFGDTTEWPVDTLQQDIEYTTSAGDVMSTETFYVRVREDITHA